MSELQLPKSPSFSDRVQAVWFETHWRPIFDALKVENLRLKAMLENVKDGNHLLDSFIEMAKLIEENKKLNDDLNHHKKMDWANTERECAVLADMRADKNEAYEEIKRLNAENSEMRMQADRDAARADKNATLYGELKLLAEKYKTALENIRDIKCPRYLEHPQSVWWEKHVQDQARAVLNEQGEKKDE